MIGTSVVGWSGSGSRTSASGVDDVDPAAGGQGDLGVEIVEHRRVDPGMGCGRPVVGRVDHPMFTSAFSPTRHD